MELDCAVQEYAWGVPGKDSSVAQLAAAAKTSFNIQEDIPYAELWMGTHPNGPSVIKGSEMTLDDYIKKQPEMLGKDVLDKFGPSLPFLFKVLSVNKALSIQAHPNKTHAEELHSARPDVYKDPNHKPEMALALTPFQALCGFRPKEEIIEYFKTLPELCRVIGEDKTSEFQESPTTENLKKCFTALMIADKDVVTNELNQLQERMNALDEADGHSLLRELFLRTHSQYPGDGGCFSIYLMNYINLKPGEALFLGPNIIHAYLLGSCMECMACSDNVVRAGLTPKYQDVETLTSMLDYNMTPAESCKFKGSATDDCTTLFNPPVPDFAVEMINVPTSKGNYVICGGKSASILAVVEGSASTSCSPSLPEDNLTNKISRGSIIFLKAGQNLSLELKEDLVAYRALCVL